MERESRNEPLDDVRVPDARVRPSGRKVPVKPISIAVAVVLGLVLIFALLPTEVRDKALGTLIGGFFLGGVYAFIALGVVVVYKASKIFNLAYGGILLFCAYLCWWLSAPKGLPIWSAVILSCLAGIVMGLLINHFLMRRMIGQSGLSHFIVTMVIGFSVITGLSLLTFGSGNQVMPKLLPAVVSTLEISFPSPTPILWASSFP